MTCIIACSKKCDIYSNNNRKQGMKIKCKIQIHHDTYPLYLIFYERMHVNCNHSLSYLNISYKKKSFMCFTYHITKNACFTQKPTGKQGMK